MINRILIIFFCCIAATGCKKKIVIDALPTIRYEQIDVPTTDTLLAVHFVTPQLGFVAGDNGLLLRTTNAGVSWQDISLTSGDRIAKILFINASTGLLATNEGLLRTVNGGDTWTVVEDANSFSDISFADSLVGFACGGGGFGVVYKTINGGATWNESELAPWPGSRTIEVFSGIHFLNRDTGYAVGDERVTFYTYDGGDAWSGAFTGSGIYGFTDVYYTDEDNGYVVGEHGIFEREPGNDNLIDDITYDIHAIDFRGPVGLAVGENCVYMYVWEMTEFGKWSYMRTPEGESFNRTYYDVSMTSEYTAFAAGADGTLTKFYCYL